MSKRKWKKNPYTYYKFKEEKNKQNENRKKKIVNISNTPVSTDTKRDIIYLLTK